MRVKNCRSFTQFSTDLPRRDMLRFLLLERNHNMVWCDTDLHKNIKRFNVWQTQTLLHLPCSSKWNWFSAISITWLQKSSVYRNQLGNAEHQLFGVYDQSLTFVICQSAVQDAHNAVIGADTTASLTAGVYLAVILLKLAYLFAHCRLWTTCTPKAGSQGHNCLKVREQNVESQDHAWCPSASILSLRI